MHPKLINGPFGDPGILIDFLHEKRAILFDLGDITAIPSRTLLRITHVFVSHTHMDHFIGFDRLLRVLLGRQRHIHITGPAGFIARVEHKLGAYSWNLAGSGAADLCFDVHELAEEGILLTARFCFSTGFQRKDLPSRSVTDGIIFDEANYQVRTVQLDHRIPCLAFSIEEKQHFNVWRNKVSAMGLGVGPWLRELKEAVIRGNPDETIITARWRENGNPREASYPLHELRQEILRVTSGQKVTYVTDVGYTPDNVRNIISLVQNADLLFIESAFLDEDADIAKRKMHLTARQAGDIARRANAKRFVQFHFSPRYEDRAVELQDEAMSAFTRRQSAADLPLP
jgi:ribonuclease Z